MATMEPGNSGSHEPLKTAAEWSGMHPLAVLQWFARHKDANTMSDRLLPYEREHAVAKFVEYLHPIVEQVTQEADHIALPFNQFREMIKASDDFVAAVQTLKPALSSSFAKEWLEEQEADDDDDGNALGLLKALQSNNTSQLTHYLTALRGSFKVFSSDGQQNAVIDSLHRYMGWMLGEYERSLLSKHTATAQAKATRLKLTREDILEDPQSMPVRRAARYLLALDTQTDRQKPKAEGGRPNLVEKKAKQANLYRTIETEANRHLRNKAMTIAALRQNKDFMELLAETGFELDRHLVRNALKWCSDNKTQAV